VVLQLQDIQKCNKQLSASTIKHAATRTYKDKRRALLIKALHTTADTQQQQHLEGYMTQTLQKELIDKVS
jgi:dTDP-D-glucose 4,6-dehydratase